MKSVKNLVLMFSVLAFCLGIFETTGNAQYRDRNGDRNRDRRYEDRDWRSNQGHGQDRLYRNRRISPQEARRLQRQRERLYRTRNRYYQNDGYVSDRERNRLQRKYYKYRRNVRRDRRDRN